MYHPKSPPPRRNAFPTNLELRTARRDPALARAIYGRVLLAMSGWAEEFATQLALDGSEIMGLVDTRVTLEVNGRRSIIVVWVQQRKSDGTTASIPKDIVASAFAQRRNELLRRRPKDGIEPDISDVPAASVYVAAFMRNLIRNASFAVSRRYSNVHRRDVDLAECADQRDSPSTVRANIQVGDLFRLLPSDSHREVLRRTLADRTQDQIASEMKLSRDQVQQVWHEVRLAIGGEYPEMLTRYLERRRGPRVQARRSED